MNNFTTANNFKTSSLTLEKLQEAYEKISSVPNYDTLVGHPDKLKGFGYTGMSVHTDKFLTDSVQIKFPRSKKKRIRKKWSKNKKYFSDVPSDTVYLLDTNLISSWNR